MHIRALSGVVVLAAMSTLAGCGQGQNAPGHPAPPKENATQMPAPGASQSSQPMSEQSSQMQQSAQGAQSAAMNAQHEQAQTMASTEFAALDTNGDGKLEPDEWNPSAVGGLQFAQVDKNGNGDIDREEFLQAMKMAGAESPTGSAPMSSNSSGSPPSQQ